MSVIKITKENFESIVMSSKQPVLLDFYADWCGPCKMVSPIVDEIAEEHSEYTVGKINVDDEPELASKFGVVSIPSLFVIKNSVITDSAVGVRSKSDLLNMLD